jgi:hypothetical protein
VAKELLQQELKNYTLTFIDFFGDEQLVNSNAEIASLVDKPFYKSMDNAVAGAKKVIRNAKHRKESFIGHWYNKAIDEGFKEEDVTKENAIPYHQDNWGYSSIKSYRDAELIIENGFNIREVSIKII